MNNGKSQEVAKSVWACGVLGIKSSNLMDQLASSIECMINEGNSQYLANICYGIVCSGVSIKRHKLTLSSLWSKLIQMNPDNLQQEELKQLVFVKVVARSHGIHLDDRPPRLQHVLELQ